jgi:hypothetical protein
MGVMPKIKLPQKPKWYTEQDAHGASSKWGQMIGDAFANAVIILIENHLAMNHPQFVLLEPIEGKTVVRLEMFGGTSRQLDNVIAPKNSDEPIALFESKWLKDARHHNDKGAWILQLKEVRKKYPTVRGAVAILAGYWTEGVGVMFKSEAGVQTVLVATDSEVYSTLQEPINQVLRKHGLPTIAFDVEVIRNSLPRPHDLANALIELKSNGSLDIIAATWFSFAKGVGENNQIIIGGDLIKSSIDSLLDSLPENPQVKRLEIALEIDTGNIIYHEFDDEEAALEFIQTYFRNPQAILNKITPKQRSD